MEAQTVDAMVQLLPWRSAPIVEAYKGLGSASSFAPLCAQMNHIPLLGTPSLGNGGLDC